MSPLRAAVVAAAFVDQMKAEGENLRKAKTTLESALASGLATEQARKALDDANEMYKANSVTIRKHTHSRQSRKPRQRPRPLLGPLFHEHDWEVAFFALRTKVRY